MSTNYNKGDNILCLVTGGAGFIGSNLCRKLLSLGYRVRVFDNFSTGKRENLHDIAKNVEIITGDLTDLNQVTDAVKGVHYIFHQGALPSVPRSLANPRASHDANITGTLNVLLAARDLGAEKVIYASSSSVYGDTPVLPKVETMKPNPLSPYALTKLAGEYYCGVFYKVFQVKTICLRYFNVFGPYQDPESQYAAVIPRFIKSLIKKEPPVILGDGEQSRDFTFVENVIHANILAANSHKGLGQVFNIACGKRRSINYLASKTAELLNAAIKPKYSPKRPGDVLHSQADISAAEEYLGYQPLIHMEEGLQRTVEWYLSG